jgi:hypothetical protein
MAQTLVVSLQDAEDDWRAQSPDWTRKIREWENWKLRSKERERLAERAKKQKQGPGEEKHGASDHSWESVFDPEDPTPAFSFAGSHTSYTKADLDDDVDELSRWTRTPEWALEALKRGIAVHHAGMNKRYRSLVERYSTCRLPRSTA